jgi:aldehyde oxidase
MTCSLCLHLMSPMCSLVTGEIHIGGQEHFYMETQSMLVVPKGEDGEIDIYVSTQFPKYIQVTWGH